MPVKNSSNPIMEDYRNWFSEINQKYADYAKPDFSTDENIRKVVAIADDISRLYVKIKTITNYFSDNRFAEPTKEEMMAISDRADEIRWELKRTLDTLYENWERNADPPFPKLPDDLVDRYREIIRRL